MLRCLEHLQLHRATMEMDIVESGSSLMVASRRYLNQLRSMRQRTDEVVRHSKVCVLSNRIPSDAEFQGALLFAWRMHPTLSPRALFQVVNEQLDIDGWTMDIKHVKKMLKDYSVVVCTIRTHEHVITCAFTRKATWIFDVAGMHDLSKRSRVRDLVESLIACRVCDATVSNMPQLGGNVGVDAYLSSYPMIWDGPGGKVCILNCVNLQEWQGGATDDMCRD